MTLSADEQTLLEAFESMLRAEELGLAQHESELQQLGQRERGFEYLHNQIDEMFHHKTTDLAHHEGVCAAFTKVHSYKYIDDPTFEATMVKELTAQGVPTEERERAVRQIPDIIEQLRGEAQTWSERDAGWCDLEEIREQTGGTGEDDRN